MIPKRAISKAIEGGWQNGPQRRAELDIGWSVYEKIALDPSFWQALGKALVVAWEHSLKSNARGEAAPNTK